MFQHFWSVTPILTYLMRYSNSRWHLLLYCCWEADHFHAYRSIGWCWAMECITFWSKLTTVTGTIFLVLWMLSPFLHLCGFNHSLLLFFMFCFSCFVAFGCFSHSWFFSSISFVNFFLLTVYSPIDRMCSTYQYCMKNATGSCRAMAAQQRQRPCF